MTNVTADRSRAGRRGESERKGNSKVEENKGDGIQTEGNERGKRVLRTVMDECRLPVVMHFQPLL